MNKQSGQFKLEDLELCKEQQPHYDIDQFAPNMKVQLKSGGPIMKVIRIDKDTGLIRAAWQSKRDVHISTFFHHTLIIVKDTAN